MNKLLSVSLLLCFSAFPLFADSATDSIKKDKVADKRVVTPNLTAIIINGETSNLPPPHVTQTTKGADFYRVSQTVRQSDRNKFKRELEKKYVGKAITFDQLKQIKVDVQNFFRDNGQALVIVSIPEQEVKNGVIVVNVLESKAGTVEVKGNQHFSKEQIEAYITVQPGDTIQNTHVERDAFFLSLNPYRKVEVHYSPGTNPGTTDITYNVHDERTFKFYAGADDTGFKVTDYNRVFFGFNWGNFLDLDQIITFQYTASPDFSKFQAFTGNYTIPLPNQNQIVFFGGYSKIKAASDVIPANVNQGQSLQASGRYVYPFYPRETWSQEVKAGIDYKRTNNDLIVGEQLLSSAFATIFQYMAGYTTNFSWDTQSIEGVIEGFIQPLTFGASMSSENYDRLRPGSSIRYAYVKGTMKYHWTEAKTGMGVNVRSVLQVATGTLLPLEELGLGGFYSVRGYPERAVNVDDGLIVNVELVSPSTSLFHRKDPHPIDSLKAVGFFDFAVGGLARKVPNEPGVWGLAGIGPAIRYDYGSYFHARGDMGIRLPSVPFGSPSNDRIWWYFSVIGSY